MIGSIWSTRISAASTVDDIVGVTRDYLSAWAPADVERLPAECKPRAIPDLDTLVTFGSVITNCYRTRRHDPGVAHLLREIVEVLNLAIDRAERIVRGQLSPDRKAP